MYHQLLVRTPSETSIGKKCEALKLATCALSAWSLYLKRLASIMKIRPSALLLVEYVVSRTQLDNPTNLAINGGTSTFT